jgi:hypothetical protein
MLLGLGWLIGGAVLDSPWSGQDSSQRRSVENRAADLTSRALAPGLSLACLDAVENADIEVACEKGLFASPEAVAAAIAYIDSRISLLAAGAVVAERDPGFRPWFERARRALEGDRFGLVAHVLVTRGCQSVACTDLKLMRDTSRILANMRGRAFESHVAMHAAAWQELASAQASLGPVYAPSQQGGATTSGTGRGSPPAKNFYPSSASIPALSIMRAEPGSTGPSSDTPVPSEAQEHRAKSVAAKPVAAKPVAAKSAAAKPAAAMRAQPTQPREVAETQGLAPPASVLLPPPPPLSAKR